MCFYNDDCEWTASVVKTEERVADVEMSCLECLQPIQIGEKYFWEFAQEREAHECLTCENNECSCVPEDSEEGCPGGDDCKCEKPNLGETQTYVCCLNCRKFLDGVEAHEKAEGCKADESRPLLFCMIEQIQEFDTPQIAAYVETARKLHPELEGNGYLRMLWPKLVGRKAPYPELLPPEVRPTQLKLYPEEP